MATLVCLPGSISLSGSASAPLLVSTGSSGIESALSLAFSFATAEALLTASQDDVVFIDGSGPRCALPLTKATAHPALRPILPLAAFGSDREYASIADRLGTRPPLSSAGVAGATASTSQRHAGLPLPGGFLGWRYASAVAPRAYEIAVEGCSTPTLTATDDREAELVDQHPTAWDLEASVDGGKTWLIVDSRRSVSFDPASPVLTAHLDATAVVCADQWRLRVHSIGASTGGMSGSTKNDTRLKIKSFSLLGKDAEPGQQVSLPVSWRLFLSGLPGQRHLRLLSSDRRIDLRSPRIPDTSFHAVVCKLWIENESGRLRASLTLDSVEATGSAQAHYPSSLSPYLPCPASIAIGGPAFMVAQQPSDNTSSVIIGEPSLAYDAPSFPSSSLRCFNGSIAGLTMRTDLAATCSAVSSAVTSAVKLSSTAPIDSFESLLLWRPNKEADAALIEGLVPLPLAPPLTEELRKRPKVLLCHDCGAAVYKEDAMVQGYPLAPLTTTLAESFPSAMPVQSEAANETAKASTLPVGDDPLTECLDRSIKGDIKIREAVKRLQEVAGRPPLGRIAHGFTFDRWSLVDVFCYFSHSRVTIPPRSWIDAAHRSGVPVLGTVITEWQDGQRGNSFLLSPEHGPKIAQQLAAVASYYGFDGWLVNIEAPLEDQVSGDEVGAEPAKGICGAATRMLSFLSHLTRCVKVAVPNGRGSVIWYDSVCLSDGRVRWQSALNDENAAFLGACDGFFADYHWTPESIRETHRRATEMDMTGDVFIGVDIFGRGQFGEGKWDSRKAVDAILSASQTTTDEAGHDAPPLSIALFAPAWTYESQGGSSDYLHNASLEARLWEGQGEEELLPASALESLSAWTISENGGQGWMERSFKDAGENAPAEGITSFFVTSHAWCEKEKTVSLPEKTSCVTVSEWHRGSGPNHGDSYRFSAWLVDKDGKRLASHSFDTDVLTTTAEWKLFSHTFTCIPAEAAAVTVCHGGKDVEHWAGHFGAQICGTKVAGPVATEKAAASSIVPLVLRRPVIISDRPFSTNFCTGRSGDRFDLGKLQPQPCYRGTEAVVRNPLGPIPTRLIPAATSSVDTPSLRGSAAGSGDSTPASALSSLSAWTSHACGGLDGSSASCIIAGLRGAGSSLSVGAVRLFTGLAVETKPLLVSFTFRSDLHVRLLPLLLVGGVAVWPDRFVIFRASNSFSFEPSSSGHWPFADDDGLTSTDGCGGRRRRGWQRGGGGGGGGCRGWTTVEAVFGPLPANQSFVLAAAVCAEGTGSDAGGGAFALSLGRVAVIEGSRL